MIYLLRFGPIGDYPIDVAGIHCWYERNTGM